MPSRNTRPARRSRGRPVVPDGGAGFSEYDLASLLLSPLRWEFWLVVVATLLLIGIPVWLMGLPGLGSMGQSLVLAGFIFVLCLLCAWGVLHFGRATPTYARLVAAGLIIGGAAFSAFAFQTDYHQRATTLLEAEVEGSAGVRRSEAPPVRELSFQVEHPGVEHRLLFWPKAPGLAAPSADAIVRVEVRDAEGASLLAHEERHTVRSTNDGHAWSSASLAFTPARGGRYTLRVTPVTPGIPVVHVRVEDPEKRDGVRVEGY